MTALGRRGSWAAQLVADGRRNGHWVVVDGHTDELVAVRDPVGARYKIPKREFAHLVRFMVVVFEGGE